jgi:adenosyl cobinamide kinase/adenosyl cobinamide phosphate guanylyltransferase
MSIYFVAGGARSGKSRKAEELAISFSTHDKPIYIATALASDQEMVDRIAKHRSDRGDRFTLIEEPKDLSGVLARVASDATVLVDCLTLWLSNIFEDESDSNQRVIAAAKARSGLTIFVSNEVGEGIVPMHPVSRKFRDLSGIMNQRFAQESDSVFYMKFGIAQQLK